MEQYPHRASEYRGVRYQVLLRDAAPPGWTQRHHTSLPDPAELTLLLVA